MYIYTYKYTYIHIYIYIKKESFECRAHAALKFLSKYTSVHMHAYILIYPRIDREPAHFLRAAPTYYVYIYLCTCIHMYLYIKRKLFGMQYPHIMYTCIYIYIYVYIHLYIYICIYKDKAFCVQYPPASTGCRRIIGCLIFTGHFLQKSPIISGSFAKNDLQLKASYKSSPTCMLEGAKVSELTFGIVLLPDKIRPRPSALSSLRSTMRTLPVPSSRYDTSFPAMSL